MLSPAVDARRMACRVISALLVLSTFTLATSCGDEDATARSKPTVTADPKDKPDDSKFAFTNAVTIADGSVSPKQTVALVNQDIVFTNTTTVAQTVRATNGTFGDTGPAESTIEPGKSFTFRQSTPLSITYEVSTQPGLGGRIQVDPGIDTI